VTAKDRSGKTKREDERRQLKSEGQVDKLHLLGTCKEEKKRKLHRREKKKPNMYGESQDQGCETLFGKDREKGERGDCPRERKTRLRCRGEDEARRRRPRGVNSMKKRIQSTKGTRERHQAFRRIIHGRWEGKGRV